MNLRLKHWELRPLRSQIFPIILSGILSLIVFFLWTRQSPYPLNWDLYEHQTIVNALQHGTFHFLPSRISDTFGFDGYTTAFHVVLSIPFNWIQGSVIGYWNALTLFHLFFTVLLSFVLGREATKNDMGGIISAVIGAFIFESNVAYTSLFLIPQTLAATLGVWLVLSALINSAYSRRIPSILILSIVGCFLIHFIIGTVIAVMVFGIVIWKSYRRVVFSLISSRVFLLSVAVGVAGLVLLSYALPLSFINQGEAEFYRYSLREKFHYMQISYGYSLLILLPVGLLSVNKKSNDVVRWIAFFGLLFLIIMFSDIPYVFKFYTIGRYFIHALMAVGVIRFLSWIRIRFLQEIAVFGTILAFMIIFITNISFWKSILPNHGIYSHVSEAELEMAGFIKNKYSSQPVLLFSDPATSYILEGLTGINSPGGAYMTPSTRQQIYSLLRQEDTDGAMSIQDGLSSTYNNYLVVVTGRTTRWLNFLNEERSSFFVNVWSPVNLSYYDLNRYSSIHMSGFSSKMVYRNASGIIFELKQI